LVFSFINRCKEIAYLANIAEPVFFLFAEEDETEAVFGTGGAKKLLESIWTKFYDKYKPAV